MTDLSTLFPLAGDCMAAWPITEGEPHRWRQFSDEQLRSMAARRLKDGVPDFAEQPVEALEHALLGYGRDVLIATLDDWSRMNTEGHGEVRQG